MEYRKIGKSDIKASKLGMGARQASPEWNGKDREVEKAAMRNYELGVTLMDTAEAYGHGYSEQVLGRAVKKIGRDHVIVATKVHGANLGQLELQKACRASASRLGVKEIDIYQVHWPDNWEQIPLKETMRAGEALPGWQDSRYRCKQLRGERS